ncbi:MAG: hypothetical protein J3Q66DRAFT_405408 [Benniella sp.]|nr:MAG: hypothetical protein J3Q66DRAFT_405408 [Benniella sp.]
MNDQTSVSQPQEITQLFVNFGIPVCNNPHCLFDSDASLCESNILDLPPQQVTVELLQALVDNFHWILLDPLTIQIEDVNEEAERQGGEETNTKAKGKGTRLTKEEKLEIIELRKKNPTMSVRMISKELGVSKSTAHRRNINSPQDR